MAKIGIVGNFGNWKCKGDGQTIKTIELYDFLLKTYKDEVIYVDVDREIGIVTKIKKFFRVIKDSENVIVILSYRGYMVLLPIIQFFNIFYKKPLYDFVIGGSRYQLLKRHKLLLKLQKNITKIYVETNKLLNEYKKIGINNCEVIPNFKKFEKIENINTQKNRKDTQQIYTCTFTRVHNDKGILDSINAVKLANKKLGKDLIKLDIYGAISYDYEEEFKKIRTNFPSYIKYKGMANSSEAIKILQQYDIMLFLTFHPGEGFPGTIIDSFFSGLPIIATNWNSNGEIVEENITGNLVEVHDIEKVSDLIVKYYNEPDKLEFMSLNCIKKSKEYLPQTALKKFIGELEKNKNERNL